MAVLVGGSVHDRSYEADRVPCWVIDSHCHLTFKDFSDVDAEMRLAAEHGVTGAITISTSSQDCERAMSIAESHPAVWFTSGVHPLYSDKEPHDWALIERCARHERCVGWGELGLDNHYDRPPRDLQHAVLHEQLRVIEAARDDDGAAGLGKPIVIHCRKAFDDLLPVLRSSSLSGDRFVFHCFTGNAEEARAVLDFGAMISFTGVVTYSNAKDVQAAAMLVPDDRIMVETDAPFLAPVPKRGERPCRPWMTSLTAKYLAELRGSGWDEFHRQLCENSARFFGIDPDGVLP